MRESMTTKRSINSRKVAVEGLFPRTVKIGGGIIAHSLKFYLIALEHDTKHLFGFWHGGRFSQNYRKLFWESPSEILKK
jgi:hypothetical protein